MHIFHLDRFNLGFFVFFSSALLIGGICAVKAGNFLTVQTISREALSSEKSREVWFTKINLALRSTVNGPSVKRLPTVSRPTLWGPHSPPERSPTAKYRLVNLTSGLRCLWEKLAALLSPTCLFKKPIVATAEKWWAELAGSPAADKTYIWSVAADEGSHIVYGVIKLTGVAHREEKSGSSLLLSRYWEICSLLLSDIV